MLLGNCSKIKQNNYEYDWLNATYVEVSSLKIEALSEIDEGKKYELSINLKIYSEN